MTDQDNTPARPAEPTPGQAVPPLEAVEAQAPAPAPFSSLFTPVLPPTLPPAEAVREQPEGGDEDGDAPAEAPAAAEGTRPGEGWPATADEGYQGFSDLFRPRVPPTPVAPASGFERLGQAPAVPGTDSLFRPVVAPVDVPAPAESADDAAEAPASPVVEPPAPSGDGERDRAEEFPPVAGVIADAELPSVTEARPWEEPELLAAPEPESLAAPEPESLAAHEPEPLAAPEPEPVAAAAEPAPATSVADLTPFSWEELVRGATERVEQYRPEPVAQDPLPAHPVPVTDAWAQPAVPVAEPAWAVASAPEPAADEPEAPAEEPGAVGGSAAGDEGAVDAAPTVPTAAEGPSAEVAPEPEAAGRPTPAPAPWLLEDDFEDDLLTPRAARPEPSAGPSWHDLLRGAETPAEATSATASDAVRDESWPWADTGPMPIATATERFAPPAPQPAPAEEPATVEEAAASEAVADVASAAALAEAASPERAETSAETSAEPAALDDEPEIPAAPAPALEPAPVDPGPVGDAEADVAALEPATAAPDLDAELDPEVGPAAESEPVPALAPLVPEVAAAMRAPSFDDLLLGSAEAPSPRADDLDHIESPSAQDDELSAYRPPALPEAAADEEPTDAVEESADPAEESADAVEEPVEAAAPAAGSGLFIDWLAGATPRVTSAAEPAPAPAEPTEGEAAESDDSEEADEAEQAGPPALPEPPVDLEPEPAAEVDPLVDGEDHVVAALPAVEEPDAPESLASEASEESDVLGGVEPASGLPVAEEPEPEPLPDLYSAAEAVDEPTVEAEAEPAPAELPSDELAETEPEFEPEAEAEAEAEVEPEPEAAHLPTPAFPPLAVPVAAPLFAAVTAPAPPASPVAEPVAADPAPWFGMPAAVSPEEVSPEPEPVSPEPDQVSPEPVAGDDGFAPEDVEEDLPEAPAAQAEASSDPADREVTAALRDLAAEYGVATEFWDWQGQHRPVSHRTLVAVLKAMDVEAGTDADVEASLASARQRAWSRTLPPIVVVRRGKAGEVAVHVPHGQTVEVVVVQEDGVRVPLRQIDRWVDPRLISGRLIGEATFALPADLPLGWHSIEATSTDGPAQTPLVVAPDVLELPPALREDRSWGYMVQLYSLRSRSSWGLGDLADLSELATWSAREQGAGFVLINPLHAAEPIAPMTPSPYLPTTRRFANPIYLRVEDIREVGYLPATDRAILEWHAEAMRAMNTLDAELDRDSVWAAKRSALETVFAYPRSPAREVAFRAFIEREGKGLLDFATWCALAERYGLPAHRWPDHARDPHSPAVAQLREELADRIEFHMWLQWCLDEQLATVQRQATEAGMPIGVIADLAVGVHPDGAEPWALQGTMAHHVSVGAPPDAFNQQGQDWSQPPWRPDRLAEAAYAPYRDMLRTLLRHAGGIRVDHILGLFRLWWIPNGQGPEGGTYVRYDHEAMVGILTLEAHRAGALVVGEDLGTVEPWVRDYLRDRGVMGTSVAWWERGEGGRPLRPQQWRELCLATVTTHDLPPTAGYLAGEHIEVRSRLGLLTRSVEEETRIDEADREQVLAQLRELGLLSEQASERERVEALHRFLTRTPAKLLGVALPDAVGDRRAMNQPGTNDEYPNWRLPLADGVARPVLLEDLMASARAASLGEVMNG